MVLDFRFFFPPPSLPVSFFSIYFHLSHLNVKSNSFGLSASREVGLGRPTGLTHPSTCISNPIPSSPPSNLYPLPHKIQCVISFPSPPLSSSSNILYNGGINGRGRFKSRSENTRAGREAIAGDIDGSNNIRMGLPDGSVLVKYSKKGFRAGFS